MQAILIIALSVLLAVLTYRRSWSLLVVLEDL